MSRPRIALSISLVGLVSLLVVTGFVGSRLHVLEKRAWHTDQIDFLSFSEDDSTLVACANLLDPWAGRVSIIDRTNPLDRRYGSRRSQERTTDTWIQAAQLTSDSLVAVDFHPEHAYSLVTFDRDDLARSRAFTLAASFGPLATISPSGRFAAFTAEGHRLAVIDRITEGVRSLDTSPSNYALAFSEDEEELILSKRDILGTDDAVDLFRWRDGAREAHFDLDFTSPHARPGLLTASVLEVALAPRHHLVLQLLLDDPKGHRSLRVWSLPGGKEVTPKAAFKPDENPTSFALSHKTDEIAIGLADGHISVRNLDEFLSK